MNKPKQGEIHIYTDGSISKNPGGTGAHASIVVKNIGDFLWLNEKARSDFVTTSNIQEMKAALLGLSSLKAEEKHPCSIKLFSDSQYLVNGFLSLPRWMKESNFKDRPNVEIWEKLYSECTSLKKKGFDLEMLWVKGHSNNHFNDLVDDMARRVMRKAHETQKEQEYSAVKRFTDL